MNTRQMQDRLRRSALELALQARFDKAHEVSVALARLSGLESDAMLRRLVGSLEGLSRERAQALGAGLAERHVNYLFNEFSYDALYPRLYSEESLRQRRFYNVGAGHFSHPYWTNLDKTSEVFAGGQVHLEIDLLEDRPLPIDTGTAELFYASHVIEHIPDDACRRLLAEIRRCLKPGGALRLLCPDAHLAWEAYRRGDPAFFHPWQPGPTGEDLSTPQAFLMLVAGQRRLGAQCPGLGLDDAALAEELAGLDMERALERLNASNDMALQRTRPELHVNWFTAPKLEAMLRQAGFGRVERSAYGQSRVPVLRDLYRFDHVFPWLTLYVEAGA